MIPEFAILVAVNLAGCPAPVIDNRSASWNKQDQQTYEKAQKRCGEIYPEAPCLKMFRKKDDSTYNAVCGEKARILE